MAFAFHTFSRLMRVCRCVSFSAWSASMLWKFLRSSSSYSAIVWYLRVSFTRLISSREFYFVSSMQRIW